MLEIGITNSVKSMVSPLTVSVTVWTEMPPMSAFSLQDVFRSKTSSMLHCQSIMLPNDAIGYGAPPSRMENIRIRRQAETPSTRTGAA